MQIAKFVQFVAKTNTKPKKPKKKCFFANYDKLVRLPTYLSYECLLSLDVSVKNCTFLNPVWVVGWLLLLLLAGCALIIFVDIT